jgi:hypothetical protein
MLKPFSFITDSVMKAVAIVGRPSNHIIHMRLSTSLYAALVEQAQTETQYDIQRWLDVGWFSPAWELGNEWRVDIIWNIPKKQAPTEICDVDFSE